LETGNGRSLRRIKVLPRQRNRGEFVLRFS